MLAAHACVAYYLDLLDARRVEKEGALHTNTMGNAAYGKITIDATPPQAHDHALEGLQALAVSLDDFDLQAHSVA